MSDKKLFLLDGHALVYRAHFAFINRPLINSKGINTSAITGFVRSLWDILVNQKPTHIAVSFDPKGKTFRHDQYPEYKANRDAQPEDIAIAIPIIQEILKGFKIPVIIEDNYEADDVIGTLAKQAESEGFDVYMVTPDKDYAQLVSHNVFMYKPSRMGNGIEILGEKEILEKWNIARVDQVIDILGLQGDSVDNIPGVPGIGPKTAVQLLKQFDSVEGILSNVDQLKGKQKENLITFAEQARMSKELATIKLDVPIQFDADVYILEEFDKPKLEELFKELEFRSLAIQILGQSEENKTQVGQQQDLFSGFTANTPKQKEAATKNYAVVESNIENVDHEYILIDTPEKRRQLVSDLLLQKIFAYDTETTGINAHEAELVGLSFAWEDHKAYYVPVPTNQDAAKALVKEFEVVLCHPEIEKVGQNIKYDNTMLKWYGIDVAGPMFDTMIAHYLSEPDLRHKLDYLTEAYLKYKMVPIENLIGKKGKNQLTMRDVPLDKIVAYAGEDADLTLQLVSPLTALLEENESVSIYRDIEEPLISVLGEMEYNGVRINPVFLKDYSVDLGERIHDVNMAIYKLAGSEFNIASPKQVGEILFERLKIPYRWKKTGTQYSTDVEKLSELASDHKIIELILEHRKLSKLKSTYVDSLPLLINQRTGRVHSNFNQARAATGRLSSDNPNLQNIPIRDEAGREIRKAFEPRDENHILLAADYSQIELRLIAEISQDEAMLEAFIAGNDFHRATAAKVYNTPYDEVTDEQRRNAKTVNFSITYGAGSSNLSRQLGIKTTEAKELINNYFEKFSGLKRYMDETVDFARTHGYVQTMLGRRRSLRDIDSRNGMLRSNAERMAINTPIQGTAADMIKIAMINIHKALKEGNYQTKMIMQVHDELVFDVLKSELDIVKPLIEDLMKSALPNLKVPILVGMGTGENWLEAH